MDQGHRDSSFIAGRWIRGDGARGGSRIGDRLAAGVQINLNHHLQGGCLRARDTAFREDDVPRATDPNRIRARPARGERGGDKGSVRRHSIRYRHSLGGIRPVINEIDRVGDVVARQHGVGAVRVAGDLQIGPSFARGEIGKTGNAIESKSIGGSVDTSGGTAIHEIVPCPARDLKDLIVSFVTHHVGRIEVMKEEVCRDPRPTFGQRPVALQ